MDNEVKATIKLKKNGTPYKRQPQPKKVNVVTSDKVQLIDQLDKTHTKTFTTDSITVTFN